MRSLLVFGLMVCCAVGTAVGQSQSVLPVLGQAAHFHGLDDMADHAVRLVPAQEVVAGKRASATYQSGTVRAEFNGVVLHGSSSDKELTGRIRFLQTNGTWEGWHDLYIVFSATDAAFLGAYRGTEIREGMRFELEVSYTSDATVRINGAGVFDNRNDDDAQSQRIDTEAPQVQPRGDGLIIPPVVHRRSVWGASDFRGNPIPLARPSYEYLTFHHAAGFNAENYQEGLAQVKAIQDFHQNGRGWSDIGYHFVLDRSGNIFQGRPFMDERIDFTDRPVFAQGAHVGGANTGNIGICLLGCYHPPEGGFCEQSITPAAMDSLITLMAYLSETYDVSPTRIAGHRDFSSTSCPGDNNYALLDQIRASVQQLLITGNQNLGAAALTALVDEQGVVEIDWDFIEDAGIVSYTIERVVRGTVTVIYEGDVISGFSFADVELTNTGAVTYRLVARRGDREQILATATVDVERPSDFMLAETFPNPLQDAATIRYFLDREGIVTLEVYDALGRVIDTLVDEYKEAGVWYPVQFDASGLASGTYYYRIRVEGFTDIIYDETHPLIVVR